MLLFLLDAFLTLVHLFLIGFNLLGWIWPSTRKLHLVCVGATAFSWLVLGIWFGWGYCPITDWQWHVKEQAGEQNLPNSFIQYWLDRLTGNPLPARLVDIGTAVLFAGAGGLSVYTNFFRQQLPRATPPARPDREF